MEKVIESDISITNVLDDEVVIKVVEDVQVQVADATVVDGIVEPHAVVVNVEQV